MAAGFQNVEESIDLESTIPVTLRYPLVLVKPLPQSQLLAIMQLSSKPIGPLQTPTSINRFWNVPLEQHLRAHRKHGCIDSGLCYR